MQHHSSAEACSYEIMALKLTSLLAICVADGANIQQFADKTPAYWVIGSAPSQTHYCCLKMRFAEFCITNLDDFIIGL
jgi:hypothetical protein